MRKPSQVPPWAVSLKEELPDTGVARAALGISGIHAGEDVNLGAIRGIALDENPFGPGGRDKVAHHLAKQGIFRLILSGGSSTSASVFPRSASTFT